MASHLPNRPRLIGALFGGLVVAAGVFTVYAVHASMPLNPIELPLERGTQLPVLLPEGWKFFTRNPREAAMAPYVRGDDGLWRTQRWTSGSHNLFGLSRKSRSHGVELGLITHDIPKRAWIECRDEPSVCLERELGRSDRRPVINTSPQPVLCGTVGFVSTPPVPWAWTQLDKPIVMPSRVVIVEVTC